MYQNLHVLAVCMLCIVLVYIPMPAKSDQVYSIEPQLRLSPGMHTGRVNRISANQTCTRLVTASHDRTARLWDLQTKTATGVSTPTLLKTFRVPINSNDEDGKLYAVAMNPTGTIVAVGGVTPSTNEDSWSIFIFDALSAKVVAVIEDNPNRIAHLTFSKDGKYLAATMMENGGVRAWKTGVWDKPVLSHSDGYWHSYGASFDDAGWLYTVAYSPENDTESGYLRYYTPVEFVVQKPIKIRQFDRPFHVYAQPGGTKIAVTPYNDNKIVLYERKSLSLEYVKRIDSKGISGSIWTAAWTSDGRYLFAGGSHKIHDSFQIRRWDIKGDEPYEDFDGAARSIMHITRCGNSIAYGTNDPSFAVIDHEGKKSFDKGRVGPDMTRAAWGGLLASTDGTRVAFSKARYKRGRIVSKENNVVFDVLKLRLSPLLDKPSGLLRPDYDSLDICGWNGALPCRNEKSSENPQIDGIPLAPQLIDKKIEELHRVRKDETWYSLAVAENKEAFAMASGWRIRGYDYKDGKWNVRWSEPVHGRPYALNYTENRKLVIAAYGDGTIRWHDASNGKWLLALFVDEQNDDWIAWTPSGYFTTGFEGENLIGWHFNNGAKKAASFFPVIKYRKQYRQDKVIQNILFELNEERAIQVAKAAVSFEKPEPLPEINLRGGNRSEYSHASVAEVEIEFTVDLPAGYTDAVVDTLVNDVVDEKSIPISKKDVGYVQSAYVNLKPYDTLVSLVVTAKNANGDRKEDRVSRYYRYKGTNSQRKPKLFGLAIGIEEAYDEPYKLEFPVDDALAFKKALERQTSVFREPNIKDLTDENGNAVNAERIRRELRLLSSRVEQEEGNKVTVLFYAGHGVEDSRGNFYLMPADLVVPRGKSTDDHYRLMGVSQRDLYELLRMIPGRKFLFLDACRSGNATLGSFVNSLREEGRLSLFTFASTSEGGNARECNRDEHKHGCFTKALIEAFDEGKAAPIFSPETHTDTEDLDHYLRERVEGLSEGLQRPKMSVTDEQLLPFVLGKNP
ncbi:MAG: caspase family protein [Candidatus Thiodiazotropha lotti]|nr:caspase family protein [Candidatus Thiodiazotropha lotti]